MTMPRDNRQPIYVCVDVEADGDVPGLYSMVSLGAVAIGASPADDQTFYAEFCPLYGAHWKPDALAVSGFTREQVLEFPLPRSGMLAFDGWLRNLCGTTHRPIFVSDNPNFDAGFVYWYLHNFTGGNPFGHSSISLTSMIKGFSRTDKTTMKDWRGPHPHTHHALQDAKSNVHALRKLVSKGMALYGFPGSDYERSGSQRAEIA